ncbi:10840_t:CDS:2 [Ambispora gerdemannii]|uniref:10840_t:CDS:1 n=1 Tax=Ambispora gerdemannii TaxID=144530 RepID=A0A9N9F221_9GLOM|nr:10840_t:CDS:2 [Ambispora gerdemannii]
MTTPVHEANRAIETSLQYSTNKTITKIRSTTTHQMGEIRKKLKFEPTIADLKKEFKYIEEPQASPTEIHAHMSVNFCWGVGINKYVG